MLTSNGDEPDENGEEQGDTKIKKNTQNEIKF